MSKQVKANRKINGKRLNLLVVITSATIIMLSILSAFWISYGYFTRTSLQTGTFQDVVAFLWQGFYIIATIIVTLLLVLAAEYTTLTEKRR